MITSGNKNFLERFSMNPDNGYWPFIGLYGITPSQYKKYTKTTLLK